jgi:hypothetical protein
MGSFFKTFWQIGLSFGIMMGLFYAYRYGWEEGVFTGLFSGVLFGLLMAGFTKYQSRKFTQNRPLSADEKLIKEGPANHQTNGGWIYLTDSRFLFVSHKVNIKTEKLSIPLSEIASAAKGRSLGIIPNKLILNLKNGQVENFIVNDAKGWIKQIESVL